MINLNGKVVVITGAGRGIGAAAAREFHAIGAKVALLSRTQSDIESLSNELGKNAMPIAVDVSNFSKVVDAFQLIEENLGPIDILIGNAAIIEPMQPMAETDPAEWGHAIDINLKGIYYGMRTVLPSMIERGTGTIITLSSGAAHRPFDAWSSYCASKSGAHMLTRQVHLEYADKGIRVLGLSPGTVATQMQRDIKSSGLGPVAQLEWHDHVPPEWPAKTLVWMCTKDADGFLGQDVSLRDSEILRAVGLG